MIWIALIFLLIAATFSYGALSAAPWVPMWQRDTDRVIKIMKSQMQLSCIKKKCVYELGAGDGRMLAALTKTGYEAIGFEISILPFVIAMVRKIFTRADYTIKYKNFWSVSLVPADVVFFFLMPQIMQKLRLKLEHELRSGTLVVSYAFSIPGWKPVMVDQVPHQPKIFVYEKI